MSSSYPQVMAWWWLRGIIYIMANRKGNQKVPDNVGKKYVRTAPYDPRVDMFKQFYMRPDSYTFMNARGSALRAGYTEQYANNITVQRPKWYAEMLESSDHKRAEMLKKAESRLYERVEESVERGDNGRLKIQTDVAKFVSERLGKDVYSTRNEVTGADGKALFSDQDRDAAAVPLEQLFKTKASDKQ